jgi:hypothetical protein
MILRTLIVLAVTQGAPTPGEDVLGELVAQVMKLRADGQHAAAAQLAAAGAARGDLAAADRVMLGGLAGEGFQASFAAGGAVADLCGLAAVMRLVAPLDVDAGGQQELATAIAAEKKLAEVAGPEWRTVCEPTSATSGPLMRRLFTWAPHDRPRNRQTVRLPSRTRSTRTVWVIHVTAAGSAPVWGPLSPV